MRKHNIFICYRRGNDESFAGRLYDNLKKDFEVFFDRGSIKYGEFFPNAIKDNISKADVVFIVIGQNYCKEFEKRKQEQRKDFVIEEISLSKSLGCTIIPILVNGIDMPECFPEEINFVQDLNAVKFYLDNFDAYISVVKQRTLELPKKIANIEERNFIRKVTMDLEREQLIVLFSQDFTKIDNYYQALKDALKFRFKENFFDIIIPSYINDEKKYFNSLSEGCRFKEYASNSYEWDYQLRNRLKDNKEILLFITDLENGSKELDRQFATHIRNLKRDFNNFNAILIGRKSLAELVYGESILSPLNNAKEIFFPNSNLILTEDNIVRQITTLYKYREVICKLIKKDKLGIYATWSYNKAVNGLFWKNLLIKEGRYFVWRDEKVRAVTKEVFGCLEE